jgi:hypothetical protein
MARTKKKIDKPQEDDVAKHAEEMERRHKALAEYANRDPIITCITINPNGTIYGLADNKIYVYDDIKHTWRAL